jgi:hypothetical protein
MNFREATDELLASITLDDLAVTLGKPVQSIRMARAEEGSASFRPAPEGWEGAAAKLARKRATKLLKLAAKLDG